MALYTAYQIKTWNSNKGYNIEVTNIIGNFDPNINIPCRNNDYKNDKFLTRLKLAWNVFRGIYGSVECREDNKKVINDSEFVKISKNNYR